MNELAKDAGPSFVQVRQAQEFIIQLLDLARTWRMWPSICVYVYDLTKEIRKKVAQNQYRLSSYV